MTTGEKIRMLRKRLKLTQTELGQKLGVKTNAVSKWECGRVYDIPASKIKAMSLLFGVPASYFVDDEGGTWGHLTPEELDFMLSQESWREDQEQIEKAPGGVVTGKTKAGYTAVLRVDCKTQAEQSALSSSFLEIMLLETNGNLDMDNILGKAAQAIRCLNSVGLSRLAEYLELLTSNKKYLIEYSDLWTALFNPPSKPDRQFEEASGEDAAAAFRDWIEHQSEDLKREFLHPPKE